METLSPALERVFRRIALHARDPKSFAQYQACVSDLLAHSRVLRMQEFIQHGDVTCLEHCVLVSYKSFLLCRALGLDFRSAARGGLLHDLFLYDWHQKNDSCGLHAFSHPGTACRNAAACFPLNDLERDIIRKHMWPLTVALPKYFESLVVSAVDKYCAVEEFFLA